MEATKRPWATIPELPNDVYQVLTNGYGYLGEFYDGENVSGAANAAFVARAVNTFDQARNTLGAVIETLAQSPYRTDRHLAELYALVKETKAAMEATHE